VGNIKLKEQLHGLLECYSFFLTYSRHFNEGQMIMKQINKLSRRELEVVHLLLQGKSNKLIALALGISDRTVEFHLKNVYAKFQVSSRMELVLKLGNTTGEAISEKLGRSTVAHSRGKSENRERRQLKMDWAASYRIAVYLIGKELTMKKNIQKFHITNAILWAAAIIVAALLGAPITITSALLPALAGCSVFVAEYLLNRAE
jgi:DNA-binding CsgD family transcriptional regulator